MTLGFKLFKTYMHVPPPFQFFLILCNAGYFSISKREFLFAVSSDQVSINTIGFKLPFNSLNLSIFLLKLLVLTWQMKKANFNFQGNISKFLKKKYGESIS